MAAEAKRHVNKHRHIGSRAGISAMLTVYSVSHLLVDMCCCAAMLAFTRSTDYFAVSLIIYNFCAFALQMPIGAAADRFSHSGALAAGGCVAIAVAMATSPFPYVLSALLGIGNACFHVSGGVFVLRSDRRCTRLGLFVSPGAIGLFLGRCAVDIMVLGGVAIMICVAVLMLVCAVMIMITEPIADTYESVAPFPKGISVTYPMRNFMAVVCFFLVVCLRSFGGMTFNFAWRGGVDAVLAGAAIAAAAALGKAAGGIVSDAIGMRTTSSVTLIVCAVLMAVSGSFIPAVIAVLTFNMTMPLTLRATADICRGREGFSFGLMTFALFLGFLPAMYGVALPFGVYGNVIIAILTLAIMAAGLELSSRRTKPV